MWNNYASNFFSSWLSSIKKQVYQSWFYINRCLVELLQTYISPVAGATFGMLILEGHIICKAMCYTFKKYRKVPYSYGLDQYNETNCHNRPVLLLHGAVGSWSYLGDLAMTLKAANIPVYVINIGIGSPTEEMRRKVLNKIEEIRKAYDQFYYKLDAESYSSSLSKESLCMTYEETSSIRSLKDVQENENNGTSTNWTKSDTIPLVNIVAHSNGGNVALYSAFTQDCSFVDAENGLKFRSIPKANPHIGKLITIAFPSNLREINWMREINKLDDLFNVNAQYDALMAYKECALAKELPSHVKYINAGHVGIVYNHSTYSQILQLLFK